MIIPHDGKKILLKDGKLPAYRGDMILKLKMVNTRCEFNNALKRFIGEKDVDTESSEMRIELVIGQEIITSECFKVVSKNQAPRDPEIHKKTKIESEKEPPAKSTESEKEPPAKSTELDEMKKTIAEMQKKIEKLESQSHPQPKSKSQKKNDDTVQFKTIFRFTPLNNK